MASLAPIPRPRAAIYRRVSTLEQGERGYSLEAQSCDCRKLADELGADVVAEFTDTDKGASWDLPGLNAMLDAAKRRDLELLLVYDPDRLARRMAKQLVLEEELARSGVSIRYVTLRIGESAEDQLLKNVRSSIAEYERAKIALRTARGRRAKAERGLVVGNGWAPYGYRYTRDGTGRIVGLEPDPVTAPIVRRIFAELTEYALIEVCRRLNDEGIPTYFGARRGWSNSTILGMLDNPVYVGTAAYGKRGTGQQWHDRSTWTTMAVPALVTPEVVRATKEALAHRKSRRARPRYAEGADPYLLRNLLSCGHCGGALACVPNNGRRYYVCLRAQPARAARDGWALCTLRIVPAEPLEAHTWQRVAEALLDREHLAAGLASARSEHAEGDARRRERLDTIDREVGRLRGRLKRITAERLDAEAGSEADRALKVLAGDAEDSIRRLLADRAELEAEPSAGLSPADVVAVEQFAAEVRQGIEHAGPQERRRVFELLKLRVAIRRDDQRGLKLARVHRFGLDYRAVIELSDSGSQYKKTRLRFYTDDYAEWEAKYMPAPAATG